MPLAHASVHAEPGCTHTQIAKPYTHVPLYYREHVVNCACFLPLNACSNVCLQVDGMLVKNVLDIFIRVGMDSGMKIYEDDFEADLLTSSAAFYKRKVRSFHSCPLPLSKSVSCTDGCTTTNCFCLCPCLFLVFCHDWSNGALSDGRIDM